MSAPEAPGAELGGGEGHQHVRPEDRGDLTGLRGPGLHIPATGDVHTDQGHGDPGQGLQDGLELGPDRGLEAEPEYGIHHEAVLGRDVLREGVEEVDVSLLGLVDQVMVQLLVCLLGVVNVSRVT